MEVRVERGLKGRGHRLMSIIGATRRYLRFLCAIAVQKYSSILINLSALISSQF